MNEPHRNRSAPSTTAERKEAKRQLILAAAAAEFAESGFENTTIEKIADRAKIAKGTVYIYADSKEQLFSQCLQLFGEDLLRSIEATINGVSSLTLTQRVRLLSERLAGLAESRNDFVTIYFRSIFGASSVARDLASQSAREIIGGIERLMALGQDTGMLRWDAPAELMAAQVFMNRLVFSRMLDNLELREYTHAEQAAFLFGVHWRGFKTELAP